MILLGPAMAATVFLLVLVIFLSPFVSSLAKNASYRFWCAERLVSAS